MARKHQLPVTREDQQGSLHLLYRDIEPTLSGQVRDFVHVVSTDDGASFSSATKISNDNWVISGCPHTGASMCGDDQKIGIVWFTAGGVPGLYYTSLKFKENSFEPRQFISEAARHPQLASWGNQSAIVWEEASQGSEHNHGGPVHHESNGTIVFSILDNESRVSAQVLIDGGGGEFPVLINVTSSEILVAYTKDQHVWVKRVNQ